MPSLLGILLQVAHGLEHAWTSSADPEARAGAVIHSHDGSTHSHGTAVAVLAAAVADDTLDTEEEPEAVPPLLLLAIHAGPGPAVTPPSGVRASPSTAPAAVPPGHRGTPPVPPPRA